MKGKTKTEKAITLVALIITIVVLLILAVVAINSITNDQIIAHANNSVTEYKKEQQKEQTMLGSYETLLNGGVPSDLMKYMLGANGKGRDLSQILDFDSMGWLDAEGNTREDITILNMAPNEDGAKLMMYIIYEDVAYKIEVDASVMYTESMAKVYEPQGREGQAIASGDYAGWIILTDRNNLVEIVSPDVAKDADGNVLTLTLGSGDTASTVDLDGDNDTDNFDTAILSYNNAITTINNYCKQVMNLDNVRSVGGTNNNVAPYNNSPIKTSLASGDMQYELDFVKLSYFGKAAISSEYWLASRYVYDGFAVRTLENDGTISSTEVWSLGSCGGPSFAVRPVVINPSGI